MSAELRREAIERAERLRSARAVEVLSRAELEVREREASAWESSDGTVRAVDVWVLTDGFALGLVRSSPLVRDAVVEAITEVAPRVLGASVIDLELVWALRERGGGGGYRELPPERVDRRSSEHVRRALAGFLAASGDDESARAVARGPLRVSRRAVHVGVDPQRVEAAVQALLGPSIRARRL